MFIDKKLFLKKNIRFLSPIFIFVSYIDKSTST